VQILLIAQFAFNNNALATGISPFYANYGYHLLITKKPRNEKPVSKKARIIVIRMKELYKILKQELDFISERVTEYVNRKRLEGPDLKKGEMVYLLRKHIKIKRPSNKLNHTKLGPYRIEEKLGPVTYRLEIPKGIRIHLVFHILLLERVPKGVKPGPVKIDEET
jgi:hypothetical protein